MGELVSVVVLSYSRPELLKQALEGLSKQTYPALDVIVVDNRSDQSEEVARIVERLPLVRLVRLPTNTGFTGGMNAGVGAAQGTFTLLTEDDIVLEPDCVQKLIDGFSQVTRGGLASGTLTDIGKNTIRYAGGEVSLGPALTLLLPGQGEEDGKDSSPPRRTGYMPGCFIFGRTEYLAALGPFRSDFFLYQEDVDLCLRVLELGDALLYIPGARAGHHAEQPLWNNPDIEYHKLKNSLAVYCLHAAPLSVLKYWLRFSFRTLRAVRSDTASGVRHLRALAWASIRGARFWKERRKGVAFPLEARENATAPSPHP